MEVINCIKPYIIMILSETKLYMYMWVSDTHTYIIGLLMQDTYYC